MVEDKTEIRSMREKERVNDLLSLAKLNNGQVETIDLASRWEIHPKTVQAYVEYLVRRYDIPIQRIEPGYPLYIIDTRVEFSFFEVKEQDREKDFEDYIYPEPELVKRQKIITCLECGYKAGEGVYCGNCGAELPNK